MHFDFTPFLSRSPVELLPNRHANNGKGDCLPSSNGPQLNSYYSQAGRASLSPSQKETPRLRELKGRVLGHPVSEGKARLEARQAGGRLHHPNLDTVTWRMPHASVNGEPGPMVLTRDQAISPTSALLSQHLPVLSQTLATRSCQSRQEG